MNTPTPTPTWKKKVAAELDRIMKVRGLKVTPKWHTFGDPRMNIPTRWFRTGMVTLRDDGRRKCKNHEILCRLVSRQGRWARPSSSSDTTRLQKRQVLASTIRKHAENGKVAIVHGGRDCDMVEVHGLVRLLPATVTHVEQFIQELFDGAEGPIWWNVARPSDAEDEQVTSRDRIAEATEDGHPWIV